MAVLSYADFEREARQLVDISELLGDGWELRHVRPTDGPEETVYLVKKRTVMMEFQDRGSPEESKTPLDAGGPEIIEDDDPSVLTEVARKKSVAVNFEYHVIHSPSYQVPVLFFTAGFQSGKLVPLTDIWKCMSPFHVMRGSGMEWETVTQHEHPILCQPFYHIHPCHTAAAMATALQASDGQSKPAESVASASSYLLSWLAMFGPTIGLQVPLHYLTHICSKSNS